MIGYLLALLALFIVYKLIIQNLIIYFKYKIKFGNKIHFMFFPLLGKVGFHRLSFKKYGDTMHIYKNIVRTKPECKAILIFSGITIQFFLIDTQYQKTFLQNPQNYVKFEGPFASAHYLEEGLVGQEGKKWTRQRNFLSHQFHFNALKNRVPIIKKIAEEYLSCLTSDGKTPVNIIKEFHNITSEVMIQTFFGQSFKGQTVNGLPPSDELSKIIFDGIIYKTTSIIYLIKLIIFGQGKASKVLNTPFEKSFINRIERYNQFLENIIQTRHEQIINTPDKSNINENFLNLYLLELIKQQNQNPQSLQNHELITKREIVHQFSTFYFAGTDTTSNQATICVWLLAKYPEIQKKIKDEIDSAISNFDELKHEDLNKLEYFNAFFKESLRKYPTVPFVILRETICDHLVDDLPVPKGAFIQNFNIQQNEEKFPKLCQDYDTFNPDRFLDKNTVQDHYSFIPFSAGPRNCIGQHFALIEIKILIIYLLKNYNIILNEPCQNIKFYSPLTYTPYEKELVMLRKL